MDWEAIAGTSAAITIILAAFGTIVKLVVDNSIRAMELRIIKQFVGQETCKAIRVSRDERQK